MLPSGRDVEHPLGDDAAVSHNDDGVGLDRGELRAEFFVGLDFLWLGDGQIEFQRGLFHRGCDEFEASAFGAVRLSDHEMDAVAGLDQLFQRGNGEARRAAEDEIERHRELSNWGIW